MNHKQSVMVKVDGYDMVDWLDELLRREGVDESLWGIIADEVLGTMNDQGHRDMSDFNAWLNEFDKFDEIYDVLRASAKDYMQGKLNDALKKDYPQVFEYFGYEFVPVRQLAKCEWETVMMDISTDGVFMSKSGKNWNYKEFYEASGDSDCDLFRRVGRNGLWLPGNNMLFKYEG